MNGIYWLSFLRTNHCISLRQCGHFQQFELGIQAERLLLHDRRSRESGVQVRCWLQPSMTAGCCRRGSVVPLSETYETVLTRHMEPAACQPWWLHDAPCRWFASWLRLYRRRNAPGRNQHIFWMDVLCLVWRNVFCQGQKYWPGESGWLTFRKSKTTGFDIPSTNKDILPKLPVDVPWTTGIR